MVKYRIHYNQLKLDIYLKGKNNVSVLQSSWPEPQLGYLSLHQVSFNSYFFIDEVGQKIYLPFPTHSLDTEKTKFTQKF